MVLINTSVTRAIICTGTTLTLYTRSYTVTHTVTHSHPHTPGTPTSTSTCPLCKYSLLFFSHHGACDTSPAAVKHHLANQHLGGLLRQSKGSAPSPAQPNFTFPLGTPPGFPPVLLLNTLGFHAQNTWLD